MEQSVYLQQFAKQTTCIRSSASSKLIRLLYVLMTDSLFYVFYTILSCIPGPVPSREGTGTATYLLSYYRTAKVSDGYSSEGLTGSCEWHYY